MAQIESYLNEHSDTFLAELFDLLRVPSVSADPDHAGDMTMAAQWLVDKLAAIGMKSEVVATEGHPIVYGESPRVEGAPHRARLRTLRRPARRPAGALDLTPL